MSSRTAKPVLHPVTATKLEALLRDTPQGILLTGDKGVGLVTIAAWLAGKSLARTIKPTDAKDVIDENGSISVESIRQLYTDTRAKQKARQTYIIDDADRMTAGAQAAFLKLLEEPNQHTHFILTSHRPGHLAKTILSRLQQTVIYPITDVQTDEYIKQLGVADQTRRVQLQYIAKGLPAELQRLFDNDDYFTSRAKIITDARLFLQLPAYDRLMIAQKYQSDRSGTLALIDCALMILRQTIRTKSEPTIISQLEKLLSLRENIATQHNIKLQLAQFVL
jgi:DNA polymerase-3 subunit delta'